MPKIGELSVLFSANTKRLDSALLSVQKKLKKTESGFLSLGKSLTRKLTLPLALAAAAAIKFAADFDKAMTESLAIMGDVSSGLREEMRETAKVMSEDSVFAAKDLAAAYFFLASAGLSAENSIAALPVVTRFAQAGMFDLSIATDLLTDAQSALGLAVNDVIQNQKNMIRVSDVLVGANTLANATVQQFSEALTNQAAAAFRTVNKEVEETVAVLAAFADQGRKGQIAGQQLAIVMANLQTAWMDNREEFEKMNIEVFDAQGNMKNMADIIGDLENAFKDLTPEQKIAALAQLGFQDRARKTIQTLLGTSEKIRQYEKDLRSMGGITKEVSDNQMQSFSAQMSALGHTLQNLAIDIGNQFIPVIKTLGAIVKFIAKEFRKLPGIFKAVAAAVIVLGAAIGPVLIMYATWIKLSKSLVAINIIAFLSKAKVALIAFAAANAPLIAVIAGVLALGKVIDEGTKLFIKATDKAIAKEVELGNVLGATNALRKKLIKNEILTIGEWSEMIKKHGGDYKRVLIAIANHPAYKGIRDKLNGVSKATKNWADILKNHNIPSMEEFNDEVSRLTRKKKVLKDALDAGRIKLRTYRVEVEKVDKEMGELTGTTEEVKEATQTWLEFLNNLGFKTLKQKQGRIDILKGHLKGLSEEYDRGELSLKAYRLATKAAQDEIDNLSTTVVDTAIPAARDMSGVIDQAVDDMKGKIGEFPPAVEDAMGEVVETVDIMQTRWGILIDNMTTAVHGFVVDTIDIFGLLRTKVKEFDDSTFQNAAANAEAAYNERKKWIEENIADEGERNKALEELEKKFEAEKEKLRTAEDAARESHAQKEEDRQNSLWNRLKVAFGQTINDMLGLWVNDFLKGLVTNVANAASGIVSKLAGVGKNVVDAAGGAVGAASNMAGGFLKSIASIAGPVGIGLLVAKIIGFKNITKTVQDVWKAVSENVVNSIKAIGKVTEAVFGAAADIVSGIGKGIGAALEGIGGLIGGLGKLVQGKTTGWQKAMQVIGIKTIEILQVILNHTKDTIIVVLKELEKQGWRRGDQLNDIVKTGWATGAKLSFIQGQNDDRNKILRGIRKLNRDATVSLNAMVKLLKSVTSLNTGFHGTVPSPKLAILDPREQIDITPFKDMGGRDTGTGGGTNNFNISINVPDQLDPNTAQRITRNQILPEIIEAIKGNVNHSRTDLREAQGN